MIALVATALGLTVSSASAETYLEQGFEQTTAPYDGLLSETPAPGNCMPECHWTRHERPTHSDEAGTLDEDPGNPSGDATVASVATLNFWHIQAEPELVKIAAPISDHLITLGEDNTENLPAPFQGTHDAWFGETETGTYCGTGYELTHPLNGCETRDAGTPAGELVSPSFSVSGGEAYLRFDTWWEVESHDPESEDIMAIDYSLNKGESWTQAETINQDKKPLRSEEPNVPFSDAGVQRPPSWTEDVVDLHALAGQSGVLLRFRFDATDQLYNGFRGWGLDNISVSSEPPPAPKITGCSIGASGTPVIEGSGFLLGSKVKEDEYEPEGTLAQSATRIELPLNFYTGRQRLQVIGPEGGTGDSEAVLVDVTPSSCALVKEETMTTTTTTTTGTTSTATTSYPSKPATERGNPVVDLRTGEIEGEFEFPEAGRAEWAGVVSQGASLARFASVGMASLGDPLAALETRVSSPPAKASKAKGCKKGFVKQNGRCVNNAPVAYGHASLTAAAGRYRLIIKPSAKVSAALKKGRKLSVRLTFTFTPAHTSLRLTHTTNVSVHLKPVKTKR